jgi:hypothetical protein
MVTPFSTSLVLQRSVTLWLLFECSSENCEYRAAGDGICNKDSSQCCVPAVCTMIYWLRIRIFGLAYNQTGQNIFDQFDCFEQVV